MFVTLVNEWTFTFSRFSHGYAIVISHEIFENLPNAWQYNWFFFIIITSSLFSLDHWFNWIVPFLQFIELGLIPIKEDLYICGTWKIQFLGFIPSKCCEMYMLYMHWGVCLLSQVGLLLQGERNFNRFGGWLGKNSTLGKNSRLLEDLHVHLLASRESSSGR